MHGKKEAETQQYDILDLSACPLPKILGLSAATIVAGLSLGSAVNHRQHPPTPSLGGVAQAAQPEKIDPAKVDLEKKLQAIAYRQALLQNRKIEVLKTATWSVSPSINSLGKKDVLIRATIIDSLLCGAENIHSDENGIGKARLKSLLEPSSISRFGRRYQVVMNGAPFIPDDYSVLGSHVSKPIQGGYQSRIKVFESNNRKLRERIAHRYYVGIDALGEWQYGTEADFRDSKDSLPLISNADLHSIFPNFFISGALGISFADPDISKPLYASRNFRAAENRFLQRVDETNSLYEGLPASRGLEARSCSPRIALGIMKIKSIRFGAVFDESAGETPEKGIGLYRFSKEFLRYVNRMKDAQAEALLFFDGNTSVTHLDSEMKPEDNAYPTRKLSNLMAFWRRDIPGKG